MGASISCDSDRPAHVAYEKSHASEAVIPVHEGRVSDEVGEWLEATDPKTNLTYYYNSVTRETRWENPSKPKEAVPEEEQGGEEEENEAARSLTYHTYIQDEAFADDEDDAYKNSDNIMNAYYKKQFDKYDSDKNGVLDTQELKVLLRDLYVPSGKEMSRFIRHFDRNSDGRIEWREFRTGMQRLNPRYRLPEYGPFLQALFNKFDTDGDKFLTGTELRDVAKHVLSIPPSITIDVLRQFDQNGDELVSFEEFSAVMDKLQGNMHAVWTKQRSQALGGDMKSNLSQAL